jgi:hypothetical protein
MRPIDIQINQAKIKDFSVELGRDKPEVSVRIGLLGPGGKEISTFNMGSGSWRDHHFDIPADMMQTIIDMSSQLEEIVTKECTKQLNMIEAPSFKAED